MKWFKALGGLLVITLLFASCIKVDGEVVVADDGSADVDFLTAIDAERIGAILGDLAGDADDICNEMGGDLESSDVPFGAQNATVSEYSEDGFCGAQIAYTLPPSLDHSDNLSDLFDENTRLYKEGDNWFFESQFSTDDITGDAEDLGSEFGDIDEFFGDAEFKIVIDLPGKAIDGQNNATKVQNNGRFTWDIDLLNPPATLFAQTEPGSDGPDEVDGDGGGGGFLRILLLLLVLALIGFGIWWFLKNRGGSDSGAAMPATDGGISPLSGGMPDGSGSLTPGVGYGPPVMDGPAGASMTPGMAFPAADAAKETVVMGSDEAMRLASEAQGTTGGAAAGLAGGVAGAAGAGLASAAGGIGDTAASIGDAAAGTGQAAASNDPVWDEALGAWVIDHPTRGRLRHDPATDSWDPV